MKIYALTSISPRALRDLLHDRIRTLELKNIHNLNALMDINIGDLLFITAKSKEDIKRGDEGYIARVRSKQISAQRIVQFEIFEEHETIVGRVQLEIMGNGRVIGIEDRGFGRELIVQVRERIEHYRAG